MTHLAQSLFRAITTEWQSTTNGHVGQRARRGTDAPAAPL
jgi:hypothetical protein